MKVIPRSVWTALPPKPTVGTEDLDGLPNFRNVKGIRIVQPGTSTFYVERDPKQIFNTILKEDFNIRGYGDIQYNLGVATNVEGVFCLRGLCNRPPGAFFNYISVLALVGNDEQPTDLLLQNLVDALVLVLGKHPKASNRLYRTTDSLSSVIEKYVSPPVGIKNVSVPEIPNINNIEAFSSVHVFDLIETLSYWGYYSGRNDGVYGPICTQAVRELQADLKEGDFLSKRIDGLFDRQTREAFESFLNS